MDSDSDLENKENMNVNIELLDDTQDEVFEGSDWDDCTDIESEIESEMNSIKVNLLKIQRHEKMMVLLQKFLL